MQLITVDVQAVPARSINTATTEKWGYGYGTAFGKDCHVAQYRNDKGRVVAQKLRFKDKSFQVAGEIAEALPLFGQHLWRDAGKMLVITEGELDALSVSQVQDNKWPVVSIPAGAQAAKTAITRALEWIERFEKVIFMFDMDEPGRKAARECAELLTPGRAYIASLPLKDANEMLMEGRGREIIDAIWGAKQFRPDGLVTGEDVWAKIIERDESKALAYPWRGVQALTHGMRERELTTLVAGTGAGKSTVCRELAAYLGPILPEGERVGYIALEESVRRSALGIIGIPLNKPLHLLGMDKVTTPEVREEFERMKDKFVFYDHFGSLESQNLINRIRFMIKGQGCRYIFLDHLSIVVSGMDMDNDERRTIDFVMTNLASLSQETGANIHIVCHLKKSDKGPTHEEGRQINLDDLRGSGGIKQISNNVIAVERNQQAEAIDVKNVADIRVLKCRHTGLTGLAGQLRYFNDTGRLTEFMPAYTGAAQTASAASDFQ